jgi:HSP20 family protein
MEDMLNRYGRLSTRDLMAGENEARGVVDWRPAADISETDKEYIIKAQLPEVKKEDVDVSVHDGVISIKGERRYEKKDDSEKQHRIESFYGSFARSFSLPADVDENGIHAESKDGVLRVILPKAEVRKPKPIEIRVS